MSYARRGGRRLSSRRQGSPDSGSPQPSYAVIRIDRTPEGGRHHPSAPVPWVPERNSAMAPESSTKEEIIVQGIAASQGIAYGQIFLYLQSELEIPSYQVDPDKRLDEIARFDKALLTTRQQIAKIQDEVEKSLGKNEALIFDAHLLVLEDQALISETIREFETTGRN